MTCFRLLPLLALALACGCSKPRPSVILVTIDSFRYDEVDRVVGGQPVAPRLSAFAHESMVFDRTVAAAPWTTPSMMSVMTGMPPRAHGVAAYDRMLSASVHQFPERFKAAGYNTAAWVPAATLRKAFGFGPGFDVYDVDHFGHDQLSSPRLTRKLMTKLAEWKDKPFFVWVHLWDPHYDYNPPLKYDLFKNGEKPPSDDVQCLRWYLNAVTPPQALWLRGRYEGEVNFTDKFVGDVLDWLKKEQLDDKVIVAVMGDHGEAFMEHGWLTHANRVYEPVVHVPLMLHGPGIKPGHSAKVVSTAQLGRTLLALAGLDESGFGMEPRLPLAAGDPEPLPEAMTETVRDSCLTSLVGERYKYIVEHVGCAESLYDLSSDPGEQHDLAAGHPELVAQFRTKLAARLGALATAKVPQATQPPEAVQSLESALRSIGYVGGKSKDDGQPEAKCAVAPGAVRPPAMGEIGGPVCPSDGALRCLHRAAEIPKP